MSTSLFLLKNYTLGRNLTWIPPLMSTLISFPNPSASISMPGPCAVAANTLRRRILLKAVVQKAEFSALHLSKALTATDTRGARRGPATKHEANAGIPATTAVHRTAHRSFILSVHALLSAALLRCCGGVRGRTRRVFAEGVESGMGWQRFCGAAAMHVQELGTSARTLRTTQHEVAVCHCILTKNFESLNLLMHSPRMLRRGNGETGSGNL